MGSLNLIIEKLSMSPPTWREYIFIAVISILVVQYWVLIQEKRASKLFLNILKGKSELTESKVKPEVNLSVSELDKITKTPIDREHLKLVFGFLNGFVEFDIIKNESWDEYINKGKKFNEKQIKYFREFIKSFLDDLTDKSE